MPLYEYQCEACGHRFEKIVKFSDPPLEICPTCGGRVQKQISSPAFHLKGTGWYITDYAKKSGGSDGEKDEKAEKTEKDADKGKDTKGDVKDSASKDSASKDSASKDSASKDSASKTESSPSSDTKPAAPAGPATKD